ncbi:MAG: hypothetical protein K8S24_02220 [Candidatus Aegiribacteria sp.]|nr:hypothetical protein [Candidatus Aegiribacteria sp.]
MKTDLICELVGRNPHSNLESSISLIVGLRNCKFTCRLFSIAVISPGFRNP